MLGLWIAAWATGVTGRFTSESIRSLLAGRGLWGVVAFTVVFSAGQLLRVPSLVFVAAAVAVYGRNSGILVALLGAPISATVSFAWCARSRDTRSPMSGAPSSAPADDIDRRPG